MLDKMKWPAGIAVIASIFIGLGAARALAAEGTEVVVVSGTLDGRFLARALFHVGEFWMRVPADTEFNRWLSQGVDRKVVIRLMSDPARFADVKNVRILTGILIHQIAPAPTPAFIDVIGRLPAGDLSFVHMLFLKDELTGTFGPVTFETADFATAAKFDAYDDTEISIVIEIQ